MYTRYPEESDIVYLGRLTDLPSFDKELFRRYLVKDCLKSFRKIKNYSGIDQIVKFLEKWLNNPQSASGEQAEEILNNIRNDGIFVYNFAITNAIYMLFRKDAFVHASFTTLDSDNKIKQYLLYVKSVLFKPKLPHNFIDRLFQSQTEEELNIWLIDYAQEHDLPDVKAYLSFLYEKEYDYSLILGNKELKHLLY